MRSIWQLSRRQIGIASYFSQQRTIGNPGYTIFTGGLING